MLKRLLGRDAKEDLLGTLAYRGLRLCPNHWRPAALHPIEPAIRVVCISDTHGKQAEVPEGDILIHAGDFTGDGGRDELDSQLQWLNALPHAHKVIIAGNHDIDLFDYYQADQDLIAQHKDAIYEPKTFDKLVYLRDSSVTLTCEIPQRQSSNLDSEKSLSASKPDYVKRSVKIFGSPWTPAYKAQVAPKGFRYSPLQQPWFWRKRIPKDADIVVTHAPARILHEMHPKHDVWWTRVDGDPNLMQEVARVRPILHMFGHSHSGYGRHDRVLDAAYRRYAGVITSQWEGRSPILSFFKLLQLLRLVPMELVMSFLSTMLGRFGRRHKRVTVSVNAALTGSNEDRNNIVNKPIVVDI